MGASQTRRSICSVGRRRLRLHHRRTEAWRPKPSPAQADTDRGSNTLTSTCTCGPSSAGKNDGAGRRHRPATYGTARAAASGFPLRPAGRRLPCDDARIIGRPDDASTLAALHFGLSLAAGCGWTSERAAEITGATAERIASWRAPTHDPARRINASTTDCAPCRRRMAARTVAACRVSAHARPRRRHPVERAAGFPSYGRHALHRPDLLTANRAPST